MSIKRIGILNHIEDRFLALKGARVRDIFEDSAKSADLEDSIAV